MATVTLHGTQTTTSGELPAIGTKAPDFTLVQGDLATCTLKDFSGKHVVLNIFPSIDTGTCAQSVRQFNQDLNAISDVTVLCISRDLPFAQARFCASEGLDHVINLSDFRTGAFGKNYGLEFLDGPLEGLHSRAIVVINPEGIVVHNEQVAEIADEPNYKAAFEAI
jgi:thiol peroxidase